jgi:hypothetical protein
MRSGRLEVVTLSPSSWTFCKVRTKGCGERQQSRSERLAMSERSQHSTPRRGESRSSADAFSAERFARSGVQQVREREGCGRAAAGYGAGMSGWRDPSSEELTEWYRAETRLFEGASRIPCPACGRADLRVFFWRFDPPRPRGGAWVWCPGCRRYTHGSGQVPDWWRDRPVDSDKLMHDPDWLEAHGATLMR